MAAKKNKKVNAESPQLSIEGAGVGNVRIPELDEAAAEYKRIRDRRQEMTPKEVQAKEKLSKLMHAHEDQIGKGPDGSLRYVSDELQEVIIEPSGETLKVRPYKDPGAPE